MSRNTNTNFLRGGTYIFDYTGATSHPFKFSTTSDGTHNSGSEYTDGTNTSTSNVMKITVPHNAPDTFTIIVVLTVEWDRASM